jgi:hypothetical protein
MSTHMNILNIGDAVSFVTVGGRTSAVVVKVQGKPKIAPLKLKTDKKTATAHTTGPRKYQAEPKVVPRLQEVAGSTKRPTRKRRRSQDDSALVMHDGKVALSTSPRGKRNKI